MFVCTASLFPSYFFVFVLERTRTTTQTTIVEDAIGYEVLWLVHLVIIHTLVLVNKFSYKTLLYNIFISLFNYLIWFVPWFLIMKGSQKEKKHKAYEPEVKSKGEKPQDIKNFETLVGLMLSNTRVHPIDFPNVFCGILKTFLMK